MSTAQSDGTAAAPGWYPDPVQQRARRHERRYWDGGSWTPRVADGDRVGDDPVPPPEPDTRTALPGRAGWLALAGFLLAQVLSLAGFWLGLRLAPEQLVVRLLLAQVGLWTGLLSACLLASRRWGTGRLRADYAITGRRSDVGRGLLLALAARLTAGGVLAVLIVLAPHLAGGSNGVLEAVQQDRTALLALAVLGVLGAPLVEEIFFRGLLQRSLRCRLSAPLAVGLQAVAFGSAHVSVALGWRNVGLVLALTITGVFLGAAAEHYRRLGPSIWAHGLFNVVPVGVLLATAH